MNCPEVELEHIVEQYLAGQLREPEREQWELHYFECDRCFAALQAMLAVQSALRAAGPAMIPVRRRPVWAWPAMGLAAAAALFAAVLFTRPSHEAARNVPPAVAHEGILTLARVEPPPYAASTLRGPGDSAASDFRAAMENYPAGDYHATAAALRQVLQRHPDSADARYFLGICELLDGKAQAAVPELRSIAAAGSPYAEEAHYFLAQAYLRLGQVPDALAELKRVEGEYAPKARRLIQQIEKH